MDDHLEGAPLTEFVIESVIRDGLGFLRSNPEKLDNLFSRFTATFFNNQYGTDKIEEIKTYILNNQIKIVHAYSQIPTEVPCYSIQIVGSVEAEELQQFGNEYLDTEDSKEQNIIVADITSISYDTLTGKLQLDPATNLATICPKLEYVDSAGTRFTILSGNSNLSGDKYINIGSGKEPDLTGLGDIKSPIDFTRTERKIVRLRERVNIGCHASQYPHLTKFLHTILYYILKSRQKSLIQRGIHLDKGSASIFNRDDQFGVDNIYSRYIELDFYTRFVWDDEEAIIVDCFDVDIFTPTPTPDSDDKQQISGDED